MAGAPAGGQTQTLIVIAEVLCGTTEEFIDGGAEVSLRKRKWVGRSIVSRWMEELLRWCLAPITILAGIRWIRVLVSCSSSLANTENRKLLVCLSSRREVGVSGQSCS